MNEWMSIGDKREYIFVFKGDGRFKGWVNGEIVMDEGDVDERKKFFKSRKKRLRVGKLGFFVFYSGG